MLSFRALVAVLLFVGAGCSGVAQDDMFPADVWRDPATGAPRKDLGAFYEGWFGNQLTAMKEPPLWIETDQVGGETRARILFLPTFDPASAVTFNLGGEASFEFKQLDGAGGYEPGRLRRTDSGLIEPSEEMRLRHLIEEIAPWSEATQTEVMDDEFICLDGTQVVVEFRRAGEYKLLSRHECGLSENDPIRLLVLEADGLSGNRMIWPDTF